MKSKKNDVFVVAFAGGGTGGHIYPGLAVADSLRALCKKNNTECKIYWIGNSKGMDRDIVQNNVDQNGDHSADVFYGIPSGKLRRYFSFQNFLDLFKIGFGFIASFFVLLKIKPDVLFSKGGFVSVPPCLSAKLLKIPVFTHECDFTPGLATKLNSKNATYVLTTYEETKNYLNETAKKKCIVTGNPVRPVFYNPNPSRGLEFLGIQNKTKPILMVVGGSLGARQINELVKENIEWLCERFIVVHQTGAKNIQDASEVIVSENALQNYKPYPFIYSEMPDVLSAADIILSRAGANSIWECSALGKPMILVPLCGSGTRGDQEDNAAYFESKGAAFVLARENATSEKLRDSLVKLLDKENMDKCSKASADLSANRHPAEIIAELLYNQYKEQ